MMLSERLKCVAGYVTGKTAADVGCDHGQLAAYLLESGKVNRVYATDISQACLRKVQPRTGLVPLLGDGFLPLYGKRVDTAILCGVGSALTCRLLIRDAAILKDIQRLILSPLKNAFWVRQCLFQNGYVAADEDLVFEGGRYYPIFVAEHGDMPSFDDVDLFVGRRLIEKSHPLLPIWLKKRIEEMEGHILDCRRGKRRDCQRELLHMERMLAAYREGARLCIR